jgi:SAM-dependent methyltransferase
VNCPLCLSRRVHPFAEVRSSEYLRCEVCRLTFLAPDRRLAPGAEREHYGTHQNDPTDTRYRAFLSRLAEPLMRHLPAGAEGLDYGSGPGPTLSLMLEEQGFRTQNYDPFFAPDAEALQRSYDFITCSETVEHFSSPRSEFDRLHRMLRPGGWLGIMTEMLEDDQAFTEWHYVRDPTHVCFYRAETMAWIAARYGWGLERPARNVTLFQNPPGRPRRRDLAR